MYPQSLSYGTDPNVNRMIEETIAILNDVDHRLQALKLGIVQSVPHLAPQILARDPSLAARLGVSPLIGASPFGLLGALDPRIAQGVSPFVGAPISPFGFPPTNVALNPWTAGVSPFAGLPTGFRTF